MSTAAPGRLGNLFRWLGLTLVLLLALQLLSVLAVNGWGEESFRQLLATTLVTQSPMALVGLLLMNFPGKYRLERWLLRRPGVLGALNWLRGRRGLPPFDPPAY